MCETAVTKYGSKLPFFFLQCKDLLEVALGSVVIVVALMLITGSAPLVLCIGHLRFLFLLDLAIHGF